MNKEINKDEIINSYNAKHQQSDQFMPDEGLYRWVLKHVKPIPGTSLLDVACGMGMMMHQGFRSQLSSYGVDISYQAVKRGQEKLVLDKIAVADGERLPFADASFDLVTCIGSLEHFLSVEQGLKEMWRVVKPDGMAAIYLPNSYYLVDVLWEVGRKGYGPSHSQIVERFASFGEWRDLIEANGFSVTRAYKYNFLLPKTRTDWRFVDQRPQRLLKALSAPFIPFNLSYSFLYLCQPK